MAAQPFSSLVKSSYDLIKKNWKTFLSIALFFSLVTIVLQAAVFIPFASRMQQEMTAVMGSDTNAMMMADPSLPEGIQE